MEAGATCSKTSRLSSYEKLVAIGLALLAVISPLYIDRRPVISDSELDEEPVSLVPWLHLMLLVLILAITLSSYLERCFTRSDPYWIHRVGGSSGGLIVILVLLVLVLKCKASGKSWEA
ncbi:uncharacterized protein LOC121242133 [Juglans microcarpa x Juglans regia]|uniref:uncharacterized protein LOC121242133 n=1 Tax=Juglans microcarpa x Juglans regia TaxID=2249226 RepID=UPI001B7EDE38|nr:uncharacterized protein LOC121242133 [Juglans microcarpa x Juglans regia]